MSVSIRKPNEDKDVWEVVWDLGPDPITGKRRQRSKSFRAEKAAKIFMAQKTLELESGTVIERSKETVREMMTYWLETHATTRKPRTFANYTDEVNRHVIPYLGARQIQKLEPRDIVAWHATLRKDGKSPHAINLAHQRISQALDQAVTLGTLPRNVAKMVKPPRQEDKPERPVWNTEQANKFLAVADAQSIYGPIWRVSLATGMRRGELLGLRWQDIDWGRRDIHVRQQAPRINNRMEIGTPKNKRGTRKIAVSMALLDHLHHHSFRQGDQRNSAGDAWNDLDLVFCSGVGTIINPSNLYREYNKFVALAGVPRITLHDQRHTVISWSVADGADPKTVAERSGQEVKMTLGRYTHTSERQHRDIADALGKRIEQTEKEPEE